MTPLRNTCRRVANLLRGFLQLDRPRQLDNIHSEMSRIYSARRDHVVTVNQPIVLIAQIQRSGGTLLSQLFDGHHLCHTHPHEFYIGKPRKWNWPQLDLTQTPGDWFNQLYEKQSDEFFYKGYEKQSKTDVNIERFPFLFLSRLQRHVFIQHLDAHGVRRQRDVLDGYFTSYFNAWLDYQNLYGDKRYVVGFTPRVNMFRDSIDHFFADYPDGWLISLVREPKSWYASAVTHSRRSYGDLGAAIDLWASSTRGTLDCKRRYENRAIVLTFEQLIDHTEDTMRLICDRLKLPYVDALLTPTFQGLAIRADSSFPNPWLGINKTPLGRASQLDEQTAQIIDRRLTELYGAAKSVTDIPL